MTGGAGYIGSVLVPALLKENLSVTVIDNFMYQQPSLASVVQSKKLTLVNGDVREKTLMLQLISKADVVIPLAAIVGAPACETRCNSEGCYDACCYGFHYSTNPEYIV